MCVHARVCAYVCVCVCVCSRLCVSMCVCARAWVRARARVCVYMKGGFSYFDIQGQ